MELNLNPRDLRLGAIAAAFYADHLRSLGGDDAADAYDDVSENLANAYDDAVGA